MSGLCKMPRHSLKSDRPVVGIQFSFRDAAKPNISQINVLVLLHPVFLHMVLTYKLVLY